MSPRETARRRVSRHRAKDYWQVATHLMESARALVTLGDEEYGNAIGICLIHAVISAGDAVTINAAEVRSSSEQHADAARLLEEVMRDVPAPALRAFGAVIQAKSSMSMREKSSHKRRGRDCSSKPNASISGQASN